MRGMTAAQRRGHQRLDALTDQRGRIALKHGVRLPIGIPNGAGRIDDTGDIDGIPRLRDIGQCNDAYSAIKIAVALADAFECSVNERRVIAPRDKRGANGVG